MSDLSNQGPDLASTPIEVKVPKLGLILLIGISGSGKSTFARKHFLPTEVISSDFCRGLVSDDENDQAATADAFDLLHYIVATRLRRGLLTVVDATNVQVKAREALMAVAKAHDVMVDAIVLDVPIAIAVERNASRADRNFGSRVITRQNQDLRQSLSRLGKERLRRVHVLRGVDEIARAQIVRERSWNDLRHRTGPFDIIGDIHGCASELRSLLTTLGWSLEYDDQGRATGAVHPEGRTAVFVGDLVDRGPDTPGVLRLVMGMVAAGTALCVSGNHEAKLVRAIKGANVKISHGLKESLAQLAAEETEFREAALAFMDGLVAHYVLDGGALVVAHAGLKEAYHGRSSRRVRSFALYGDTKGETDEYGLPVRYPWAKDYRGDALVAYGHTPVPDLEWVNNTICLDTGAVFGGALSALRYPERELVQVDAERQWYVPSKPLRPPPSDRAPGVLRIDDVSGTRWLTSPHVGKIRINEGNALAALEIMSRFAVDPRWLIYLPPTMSPASTATTEGFLEHPEQAFADYLAAGVTRVVCEEKHMGSRAIAVLTRNAATTERRFGISDGSIGTLYTRTGRPFFAEQAALVERLQRAVHPLFDALQTDWVALDCELLPWSAKAIELIKSQYAAVGTAARHALPELIHQLDRASARGLPMRELRDTAHRRLENAAGFRDAYAAYCRSGGETEVQDRVTLAPFQILAVEGRVLAETEPHEWHLRELGKLADPLIAPTRHRFVDLTSDDDRAAATQWWLELTAAGGEGLVVKPAEAVSARVQPGLKVRGREYLRIIYGPDYTDNLDLLRERPLGRKRHLATKEHGLGLDALAAFVGEQPLWRVHQAVFAVLALESEPVDPRL